ncbi:MAG: TIGR03032 family protein, partial [Cyanobacteria bacterium P01_F01_bin.42]
MTPSSQTQAVREDISSSKDFLPWLAKEQFSLALSTYQTSRLFLIGTAPGDRPSCFKRLFNHAMGLFHSPNQLLMGTQDEIWQFENVLDSAEQCQGYDRLFVPQQVYRLGDLDIHDLVQDRQGQIIFANTKYSCLAALNPNAPDGFECVWQPPFISSLAPEDRCHLNGLALVEGEPRYVTCVSRSDVIDGWRQKRDSSGVVIDISSNEILATGLSMPHSPRFYRGKLWLLNSGQGEFGYVDLDNGNFEPVAFCPGYGRGLAFWKDFAIVGLSRPRDKTFAGLSLDQRLADKEAEPRCGVIVIDLNSGHIVHWMWIEGVIQELYDVQVLPNVQRPAVVKQFPAESQDPRLLLTSRGPSDVQSPLDQPTEDVNRSKVLMVSSEPKRVIAFSLWGNDPKYTIGAIK